MFEVTTIIPQLLLVVVTFSLGYLAIHREKNSSQDYFSLPQPWSSRPIQIRYRNAQFLGLVLVLMLASWEKWLSAAEQVNATKQQNKLIAEVTELKGNLASQAEASDLNIQLLEDELSRIRNEREEMVEGVWVEVWSTLAPGKGPADPWNGRPWYEVTNDIQRIAQARTLIAAAMRMAPGDPRLLFMRATIQRAEARLIIDKGEADARKAAAAKIADGIKHLNLAIEIVPRKMWVMKRAELLVAFQDFFITDDEFPRQECILMAIEDLQLLDRDPSISLEAAGLHMLAKLLGMRDRPKDAIEYLERARIEDPDYPQLDLTRALLHIELREFVEARESWESERKRIDPIDQQAQALLYVCEIELLAAEGQLNTALARLNAIESIDALHLATLILAARVHMAAGNEELARSALSAWIDFDPNCPIAARTLWEVNNRFGE